jgi:hypothetical protein
VTLAEWAARWGVSDKALAELAQVNVGTPAAPSRPITSESQVQSLVRLEAERTARYYLWRNNVGALKDRNGRVVRYGLANDTATENAILKSGDLVGFERMLIQSDHVGKVIARFVSRECKPPGWVFAGTDREMAQLRWACLINSNGGNAAIVNAEGSL